MRMTENPKPTPVQDLKLLSVVLAFVCETLAVSVEVFLHRRFGPRYFNRAQVLAVIPLVFLFILGFEEENPVPLLIFLGLYLAMCFLARLGTIFRWRGSRGLHSYYTGEPRIGRIFGFFSEITIKQYVEPLLVMGIACACFYLSVPLGAYLFTAGLGMGMAVTNTLALNQGRAMDMNDAYLDQQHAAERFRHMRGDQW